MMNLDYFFFNDKDDANNFYLKALGYGIWATCDLEMTSEKYCVTINKDKTWEAMYAKAEK